MAAHEPGHGPVPDSALHEAGCGEHPAPRDTAEPATGRGTAHRPMRRDAARNHQLVIAAAREVLTEYGTDASMELIASRAGVGVGTLYRRFPNKEALVDEIAGQMLGELVGEARGALTLPDGTGLEVFVRVFGRWLSEHRGYADKLVGHTKAACVEQLRDLIDRLLDQARAAGRVAPHIELGDVMALVWGLRGVVETSGAVTPDAWRRHTDIHLAGLRASSPDAAHPAVTRDQLTRINTGG
ncbi:putative TetR family transcriptional regulator [Actinacidiphila reveromycinica]|uniref:Putative TetR family transcriptional regulator n=1 Tax=Actinacidiphila reveromycinica TaxID=659352 RepID=A0A7U3UNH5_9ACTN|nr:TetR/AcrR family transcriptional regulator [Streptomyces sp. SN-593]BBA95828.1 putative TetR family transcriptional regulator [Streptomyces sp. SN-593]